MTPIYINNLNRLTTTKKLVEDLQKLGYEDIVIMDNGSTYRPLLDWYKTQNVVHLPSNMGQLAIYNSGMLSVLASKWAVYTDSDIELSPMTPRGFIETMIEKAEKYNVTKAGLALRVNDLPENEFTDIFKEWESKFWKDVLERDVYKAHVDTTFCVLRTDSPFTYEAIRLGGDYTCRHIPWYTDFGNLSEEERYYLESVSTEFSGYRRYYNQYLNRT